MTILSNFQVPPFQTPRERVEDMWKDQSYKVEKKRYFKQTHGTKKTALLLR